MAWKWKCRISDVAKSLLFSMISEELTSGSRWFFSSQISVWVPTYVLTPLCFASIYFCSNSNPALIFAGPCSNLTFPNLIFAVFLLPLILGPNHSGYRPFWLKAILVSELLWSKEFLSHGYPHSKLFWLQTFLAPN